VNCQSYVAFVNEAVRTQGLSINRNVTWNEITLKSTDEPITAGSVRKLVVARVLFRNARRRSLP
jgi:hypothetical protein